VTTPHPAVSQQAIVDAALLMLRQMGLSPDDLAAAPKDRAPVPTFAEYIPVVSAAVSAGTRRAYGSYWNRVLDHWGERRLDEPTPSEIRQLMSYVKTHVVARRNARGGRSAAEHLVAALRCLYKHAEDDGLITAGENPARKVDKPRRLPSTRRAVTDDRLAEICQAAADGGDDPELDTLLLRLHTETACRRGGALALRPDDLDSGQCLVQLREKGETVRWQPVSPTLMTRLTEHGDERNAPPGGQLLRYRNGRPVTYRRYDGLWARIGRALPWVRTVRWARPHHCGPCQIASPTWTTSGSSGLTVRVASSTNTAWWHRFSARQVIQPEQRGDPRPRRPGPGTSSPRSPKPTPRTKRSFTSTSGLTDLPATRAGRPGRGPAPCGQHRRKVRVRGTWSPLVVVHPQTGDPSPLQTNTARAGRPRISQAKRGGSTGLPHRSRHVT
jgi:integrase/recombinase XerC